VVSYHGTTADISQKKTVGKEEIKRIVTVIDCAVYTTARAFHEKQTLHHSLQL